MKEWKASIYIHHLLYRIMNTMNTLLELHEQQDQLIVSKFLTLQGYEHALLFSGITHAWQVLPLISKYLSKYFAHIPNQNRLKGTTKGSVHYEGDVVVGQGTIIEHGAMIKGPAVIGRNCEIRKGAYIRGNVIIGDDCVIGNSTQIKNSVLFDKAQACHFNYVGDSVLGRYAHLSAGAITSNLKLDQKEVVVHAGSQTIKTGLIKFGAIVGDKCEIGCNVVLNPGSMIGKNSVIYPGVSFRGFLPEDSICKLIQEQTIIKKQ